MYSCSSAAIAGSFVTLAIILSLSHVSLSPCRCPPPPCCFRGSLCHPVTVFLSLSRVPLSPCHCLPVTVASSSVTSHRLLSLWRASLSPFYYHRASLSPLTVSLSLSRVPSSPCHCLTVVSASSSVTPHRLPVSVVDVSVVDVSVVGVSVTLSLSQGVSITPHPHTVSVADVSATLLLSQGVSVTPNRHTAFVVGASATPHRLPVTVAGISATLSPCHCLPIAVASSSVTPHCHTVSIADVSVTLKLSRSVSFTPRCHTVSVAGVSVTLLLSQGVSVTPSPSLSLCRERLCHTITIILSLLWASLSPHHHLPVSVTNASVTMSLSSCLCWEWLSHPITVSRLYCGRLYHPITVTLFLLQVHLTRHRLCVPIAGPSVDLPFTLSLSRCLYRRCLCHPVIITMCLAPCSCRHTTVDKSWLN